MFDGLKREPGERIIVQSKRGGPAGYGGLMWLGILFGGSQVLGALMFVPMMMSSDAASPGAQMWIMTLLTLVIFGVFLGRWILLRTRPAYVITDRRLIGRRLFLPPVAVPLEDVAGAVRVLVQYTRYGRVVNELLTHRVGIARRSGGMFRIGPIADVDELVSLLQGVAHGHIDCKALPDAEGGLAAAEARTDLFYAQKTLTGGLPRGPLFVGPTKVIGFAENFLQMRQYQVLTMVGATRPAEEVEQSVLALAQSDSIGRGRAVIMDREGLTLAVNGAQLALESGEHRVAFNLAEEDAARAAKYLKGSQTHAYR
ncbi:MAG: hypothetical protein U0359_24290 [Byssovorax sp.]